MRHAENKFVSLTKGHQKIKNDGKEDVVSEDLMVQVTFSFLSPPLLPRT